MGTRLRVGVLGGGLMAHTHVQALLTIPGAELCGLSAPVVASEISSLCDRAGVAVSDDAEWLLTGRELNAVVIATPTDTHVPLIEKAAAAGLHVFCEKPLALSAREAQAAVDVCSAAGVKLAVGHVVRYFPAYAKIVELVHAGRIGTPGMAKCQRVSGPPGAARAWFADPRRSGGLIMDLGVHDFDWLRWCLGPVERVSALATRPDQGQVAVVTLAHQSGAISTVELSWVDPRGFATSVEVSGPDGLLCHDSRSSAAFSIDLWPTPEAQRPVVQMPARTAGDDPYRHELADALSWFGGGSPPRGNAIDAVGAVTLAEAANLSASRREPVAVAELINDVAI